MLSMLKRYTIYAFRELFRFQEEKTYILKWKSVMEIHVITNKVQVYSSFSLYVLIRR